MKKILILAALISSILLAEGPNEFLEDRIENELRVNNTFQLSTYNTDYNVDIYNNHMNIEIEFEGISDPKLNYAEIAPALVKKSRELTPNIDDVYIVFKQDSIMNEDIILFSKIYTK